MAAREAVTAWKQGRAARVLASLCVDCLDLGRQRGDAGSWVEVEAWHPHPRQSEEAPPIEKQLLASARMSLASWTSELASDAWPPFPPWFVLLM